MKKNQMAQTLKEDTSEVVQSSQLALSYQMETILSQIQGAGKVSVLITYESGIESVPAYNIKKNENEIQEKDTSGGTRNSNQKEYENSIVYEDRQGGVKSPVILKELQPVVKGVVIVAEGATDPTVRENLCNAVKALVDVPIHKIQVFTKGRK